MSVLDYKWKCANDLQRLSKYFHFCMRQIHDSKLLAAKTETHPEFDECHLTESSCSHLSALKIHTGPSHCFQKVNFTNITVKLKQNNNKKQNEMIKKKLERQICTILR